MYQVRKKTVTLAVSRLTLAGYWAGNGTEQVVAGTALGNDCTTVIFTPSKEGVTGKYDAKTEIWSEVTDHSQTPFWDEFGHSYFLDEPEDDFPHWAIFDMPPEYYPDTQTVKYVSGEWVVYPIQIGTPYYDQFANELIVSDYNFELPENCTFDTPLEEKQGYVCQLVSEKWTYVEDYRGKTVYNHSDCAQLKTIYELGPIEDGWTLTKPKTLFDEWVDGHWVTNLINQYEYEYQKVNDIRERLYIEQVDRLNNEAKMIRRIEGDEAKAAEYEVQANAAYLKIREENPWPVNSATTK